MNMGGPRNSEEVNQFLQNWAGFNFADIISYEFFDVPKRLKQAVMTNEAGYLFLLL